MWELGSAGAKRGRPQRGRAPNLHREFTKRFRVDSGVQKMPASPAQTGQAACIVGLVRTAQTRNHTVSKLTLFTRCVATLLLCASGLPFLVTDFDWTGRLSDAFGV